MARLVGLLVCLILVAIVTPARADLVVVRSTSPDIIPGQIVKAGGTLEVPAGASVALVSQSGETFNLSGPYSGIPGSGNAEDIDKGLVMLLSRLLTMGGKDSVGLGVMRSATRKGTSPPLAIDTGRSGTHCVIAGETPLLWRAKVGNPSSLSLKNRKSKARVNVTWPAGSETIAWPAGVPAEDGATYLARFKNHPSASKIVLHLVPGGMPTAYHQAAWMADHGCTVQGRALLSATD